ncbi:hypothetical protein H6B15_07150 [Gemmiger formicilis]|uniref:hypothetical protein n=1 Tax=Gemmiger formicilis TaxID=745368 RepID=UPI00195614D5|nr:hypothetical protein [Gemmiger formicilis]MBM6716436.1 hypothetical protein [Gemmiger formicilis]
MTESMAPYFDNNNLFDTAGCLTPSGLEALRDDRLDELGRLEAAEHLTFCDRCLARYTALLESIQLSAPMRDLIPQVQALMRLRTFRIMTNRYVSVAAAIALALALWRFGLFGVAPAAAPQEKTEPRQNTSVSQMLGKALNGASEGLQGVLDSIQDTALSGWAQLSDNNRQNHGQAAATGE